MVLGLLPKVVGTPIEFVHANDDAKQNRRDRYQDHEISDGKVCDQIA